MSEHRYHQAVDDARVVLVLDPHQEQRRVAVAPHVVLGAFVGEHPAGDGVVDAVLVAHLVGDALDQEAWAVSASPVLRVVDHPARAEGDFVADHPRWDGVIGQEEDVDLERRVGIVARADDGIDLEERVDEVQDRLVGERRVAVVDVRGEGAGVIRGRGDERLLGAAELDRFFTPDRIARDGIAAPAQRRGSRACQRD